MRENLVMWILGLVMAGAVLLAGWVGWIAWQESKRPTFELKRDDWTCTRSETRTRLQPIIAGKVTTTMPVTSSVCMEYRRVAG